MSHASIDMAHAAQTDPQNRRSTRTGYFSTEGETKHSHPSDAIWNLYLSRADKHDKETTEAWRGDMDGILIFTGLFAAVVSAFIIETYKGLKYDSGDESVALLSQISQQLAAMSNGTNFPLPAGNTRSFQPTVSSVRINVLFILSLVFSIVCALIATLIQQWVRGYIRGVQGAGLPRTRGRRRVFLFRGLERFGLKDAVECVVAVLHISVLLFLLGLLRLLFTLHQPLALITVSFVSVGAMVYTIFSALPLIWDDCPYQTPLTTLLRIIMIFLALPYLILRTAAAKKAKFFVRSLPVGVRMMYSQRRGLLDLLSMDKSSRKHEKEAELDVTGFTALVGDLKDHAEVNLLLEGIPGFVQSMQDTKYSHALALKLVDQQGFLELITPYIKITIPSSGDVDPTATHTPVLRPQRALDYTCALWHVLHAYAYGNDRWLWCSPTIGRLLECLCRLTTVEDPVVAATASCTTSLLVHILLNDLVLNGIPSDVLVAMELAVEMSRAVPDETSDMAVVRRILGQSKRGDPENIRRAIEVIEADGKVRVVTGFLRSVLPHLSSLLEDDFALVESTTYQVMDSTFDLAHTSPEMRHAFVRLRKDIVSARDPGQRHEGGAVEHWEREDWWDHLETTFSSVDLSETDPPSSGVSVHGAPSDPPKSPGQPAD